jgi:hypothetical protein
MSAGNFIERKGCSVLFVHPYFANASLPEAQTVTGKLFFGTPSTVAHFSIMQVHE